MAKEEDLPRFLQEPEDAPPSSQAEQMTPRAPTVDIAARLWSLKDKISPVIQSGNQINVIRGDEFECAVRAFSRPNFDPNGRIDVVFVDDDGQGEGAVDTGGPTRELCRLLMGQVQAMPFFEGPLRTLALDSLALCKNAHRLVGQMVSVCLIQGGVSPHFFSRRLFRQVCGLPSEQGTVEEITDIGLRDKLEKAIPPTGQSWRYIGAIEAEIRSADTLEDARDAVNAAQEELAFLGALRHVQTLEQKDEMLEAALHFYLEGRYVFHSDAIRSQPILSHLAKRKFCNFYVFRFLKGLMTLGIMEELTEFPATYEDIFLKNKRPPTAKDLTGMYKPNYTSEPGSNRSNTNQHGVSLHRFPKDEKIRNSWIKQVKLTRAEWSGPSDSSTICSDHFSEEDFEDAGYYSEFGMTKKKVLKASAIPNTSVQGKSSTKTKAKYIVFEEQLLDLFSLCQYCRSGNVGITKRVMGTLLIITAECYTCTRTKQWESQPYYQRTPAGNVLLSAATLFAGGSWTMMRRILSNLRVASIVDQTFYQIQRDILQPAIERRWSEEQRRVVAELRSTGTPLTIAGDGRADSPGHSAKYGVYTGLEANLNKIVDLQLVQSNEVKSSYHMELEGLVRLQEFLSRHGLEIGKLITDRHRQLAKHVRENSPNILHRYDVWHIAKAIQKKVHALGKQKNCDDVLGWEKSINNHVYWVASSTGDQDQELREAKWNSLGNHIQGIHSGHSAIFPTCLHGDLQEERAKNWLTPGTKAAEKLHDIITNPTLVKDIKKMSSGHQTSSLESFHNNVTGPIHIVNVIITLKIIVNIVVFVFLISTSGFIWQHYTTTQIVTERKQGQRKGNCAIIQVSANQSTSQEVLRLNQSKNHATTPSFNVTLQKVLTFGTGLEHPPPMGFRVQPRLDFLHPQDGLARFPRANTCAIVIFLPCGQTYTEFKCNMELGITSAQQFGEP
ncbi:G2/M phase-specific E3 ubiquitin-protein ligase [Merluccius polli]|uniref:G2/M phase-specific E3 ubiquitin-protein ligase n=1 Tax=Merluccius polli TaxID=89951 RepID=A0AA47MUA3_MERPO|nr:G2/M phase-specific E3 ubiquitin-protein ligase [Merluccius polli]